MTAKKTGAPRKEFPPEKMAEIEKAFRSGLMSWRAMSKEFGVGMSWLNSTADRLGWKRDLGAKIHQEAQRKEQETIAREANQRSPDYKLTEREVTESNVELIARVSGSHRATLARSRKMVEKLFDELEFAGNEKELLEDLARDLYAHKETGKADLIARLSSIPGRTSAFKQLVDALEKIIATEREVLRIADAGAAIENSIGSLINRVMGSGFKPVQEHHGDD